MQYIKLPKQINKKIDQIQRNFIWETTDSKRKLHLVNWETLTGPKAQGGLGIQNADHKNKAMLTKLAWRTITNDNCLWARLLKRKYLKQSINRSNPLRTRLEYGKIWKDIAIGWDIYRKHLKWTLSSGKNISLWYNRWMPNNKTLRETIHDPLQESDEGQMVEHILDNTG